MTTNVTIENTPGHWDIEVFRRYTKDGSETSLGIIKSGESKSHLTLWDDADLIIREIPKTS